MIRFKQTCVGLAVAMAVAISSTPTAAQEPDFPEDYERFLVPLYFDEPIAGANGSLWATVFRISNVGDDITHIEGVERVCLIGPCPPLALPGGTTTRANSKTTLGLFVWVERERVGDVAMSLRAQDLSRQSQTWGTTIPVTARDDWFGTSFSFVGVAVGTQFRSLLRLYDNGPETLDQAIVRIYRVDPRNRSTGSQEPDALLSEQTVSIPSLNFFGPGYAAVPLDVAIDSEDPVLLRIDVEPLSDETEFWGFVSITNNETQHVTIVTPE